MNDAERTCLLFARDPIGTGLHLRGLGPARDRYLATLRAACGDRPWILCPASVADDRLLGGLDVEATLATGRKVVAQGLVRAADGGILVIRGAPRLGPGQAACLAQALENQARVSERDGTSHGEPSGFGLVLLDDGADDEIPGSLLDRSAFRVDFDASMPPADDASAPPRPVDDAAAIERLCLVADAFGIGSLRAAAQAVRAARGLAALAHRTTLDDADLAAAARLVFAHRATRIPAVSEAAPEQGKTAAAEPGQPHDPDGADMTADRNGKDDQAAGDRDPLDRIVQATMAALPAGLLAATSAGASSQRSGRAGAARRMGGSSGRRIASRAGRPGRGARLDLIATLLAAAPWQRLRMTAPYRFRFASRVVILPSDFRIRRHVPRTGRTTVFVVDASGSAALQRLGEAKGAVERLLADCYRQRDRVALIAFRRDRAELLLPPTGALARARRSLVGLAGGGGTPLADGLDEALRVGERLRARGEIPFTVLLTDGRANVARDGTYDRVRAGSDAMASAAAFRGAKLPGLVIDIAPRPRGEAARLATAMGARFLALPRIDAAALSRIVRDAA